MLSRTNVVSGRTDTPAVVDDSGVAAPVELADAASDEVGTFSMGRIPKCRRWTLDPGATATNYVFKGVLFLESKNYFETSVLCANRLARDVFQECY